MDLNEPFDYLLVSILIPATGLVLKSLVGEEINYWLTFIYCYFNRPYDVDKNTETHDWAMIFNPGDGSWECCSLTFHFGLIKGRNGAFVHRYDEHWNMLHVERVPFKVWRQTRKAKLNPENLPHKLPDPLYTKHIT